MVGGRRGGGRGRREAKDFLKTIQNASIAIYDVRLGPTPQMVYPKMG